MDMEARRRRWGGLLERVHRQNSEDEREELQALIDEAVALTRKSEAIQIDPNALYSMDALESLLAGTMTVKTFLENLRLDCTGKGRLFQNAVFGHEIIQAMQQALAGQRQELLPAPKPVSNPTGKRGRPRKQPVSNVREIAGKAGAR